MENLDRLGYLIHRRVLVPLREEQLQTLTDQLLTSTAEFSLAQAGADLGFDGVHSRTLPPASH